MGGNTYVFISLQLGGTAYSEGGVVVMSLGLHVFHIYTDQILFLFYVVNTKY